MYVRESKTGFEDYKNMLHEFRPYIMFTNAHDYKSKSVNTDRLGFRKVFFKKKFIGIDDLKKSTKTINILLGGSTAFGSGSLSDKHTISSELTSLGKLCFSLGIRGASSHQELIAFLKFKNFFPKIKNIIILSGVNDLAMTAHKNSFFYNDFGFFMGARSYALNFLFQSSIIYKERWIKGLLNLFFLIHYLSNKFNFFRNFLKIFSFLKQSKLEKKTDNYINKNFKNKIINLRQMIKNDLHTWSMIQKQLGVKITYIFQPNLTWIKKPLTKYDKQILDVEKKRLKAFYSNDWTNKSTYIEQRNFIKNSCKRKGIKFVDSNEIIKSSIHKKSYFLDLAHLTYYGNQFLARYINKFLIK